jgi:hypothetical protein
MTEHIDLSSTIVDRVRRLESLARQPLILSGEDEPGNGIPLETSFYIQMGETNYLWSRSTSGGWICNIGVKYQPGNEDV